MTGLEGRGGQIIPINPNGSGVREIPPSPETTRSKIAIFVDGDNLSSALVGDLKVLWLELDFKKLLAWAAERKQVVSATYFVSQKSSSISTGFRKK